MDVQCTASSDLELSPFWQIGQLPCACATRCLSTQSVARSPLRGRSNTSRLSRGLHPGPTPSCRSGQTFGRVSITRNSLIRIHHISSDTTDQPQVLNHYLCMTWNPWWSRETIEDSADRSSPHAALDLCVLSGPEWPVWPPWRILLSLYVHGAVFFAYLRILFFHGFRSRSRFFALRSRLFASYMNHDPPSIYFLPAYLSDAGSEWAFSSECTSVLRHIPIGSCKTGQKPQGKTVRLYGYSTFKTLLVCTNTGQGN